MKKSNGNAIFAALLEREWAESQKDKITANCYLQQATMFLWGNSLNLHSKITIGADSNTISRSCVRTIQMSFLN